MSGKCWGHVNTLCHFPLTVPEQFFGVAAHIFLLEEPLSFGYAGGMLGLQRCLRWMVSWRLFGWWYVTRTLNISCFNTVAFSFWYRGHVAVTGLFGKWWILKMFCQVWLPGVFNCFSVFLLEPKLRNISISNSWKIPWDQLFIFHECSLARLCSQ